MSKPIKMPIRRPETPANKPARENFSRPQESIQPPRKQREWRGEEKLDTANNDEILAGAIARRRIDATAIAGIAKLVAKNLTESEACRRLGIQPRRVV